MLQLSIDFFPSNQVRGDGRQRERERDVLIQKDVQMADLLLSHFLNVIVLYTTLQIQKYFSLRVRVGYEATSAHISHSAPTSIRNSTL